MDEEDGAIASVRPTLSLQVVYKYLFSCVLFVFSVLYLCVLCALFGLLLHLRVTKYAE